MCSSGIANSVLRCGEKKKKTVQSLEQCGSMWKQGGAARAGPHHPQVHESVHVHVPGGRQVHHQGDIQERERVSD